MVSVYTCVGNLGQDSEFKVTGSGKEFLQFSIGVSTGWGDNKQSHWVRCTKWGKGAEGLGQHLKKGTKVTVSGELSNRSYEKDGQQRTSLELNVSQISWESTGQASQVSQSQPAPQQTTQQGGGFADDDLDKIPF